MTDSSNLSFEMFRKTNKERSDYLHPESTRHWTLVDWSNAMAGEAGEVCNVTKKMQRHLDGIPMNKEKAEALPAKLKAEIGDVAIYLDLLAHEAGFTLEECIRQAFNGKSDELGLDFRL
jgi:NTP pyrophosphatase (non-canonical NTP hydrolase)